MILIPLCGTYRSGAGAVVQYCSDVPILDLIEGIDRLYTVVEQLMKDERYTGTSGQLVEREVVGVTVNYCPELIREIIDDG